MKLAQPVFMQNVKVRMDLGFNTGNGQGIDKKEIIETTVGRAILSKLLPEGLPFSLVNKPLDKKELSLKCLTPVIEH